LFICPTAFSKTPSLSPPVKSAIIANEKSSFFLSAIGKVNGVFENFEL